MSGYRAISLGGVMASLIVVEVAQAAVIQVVAVQLVPAPEGVILRLATADGTTPPTFVSQYGRTWQADITNAQLAPGVAFEQTDPAPGIAEISVETLDANSVRVRVTGREALPVVAMEPAETAAIAFAIGLPDSDNAATPSPTAENEPTSPSVADDGDGLRITVTGEQAGSDYFVPNAGTATRTDTPIMETPAAVQVIPREVLDDQQVIELDDALRNVSGVVVDSSEGAGFQYSLRGFQGARLLRDGFSLSASDALSLTGLLTLPETANIEQIEVLKGPASILYGEIQPGGVINLVTEQPTAEPLYQAELQVGSRTLIRPQLDFSNRLTADGRLRYRLNALVSRQDSFRDFDQAIQRSFIAPVVTWDISDRTTLALDFEYFDDERPSDSGLLAFGDGIVDVPRDRVIGEPDDIVERDFFTGGYRLEHDFSDNWQLRNAFRYSSQDYSSAAFTPVAFNEAVGLAVRFNTATEWYQNYYGLQTDVVGSFATGSIDHTVLLGFDLSRDFSDLNARGNLRAPSPLNVFDPTYGTVPRLPFDQLPNAARIQEVTTTRLGFFAQDQIELFEGLNLLAGLRYDTVTQDVDNAPSLFSRTGSEADQTIDAVTPRLGIVYQPLPELSLYASYSQSFTPNSGTDVAGDLLTPESGEGVEIGIKTELFDSRLIATLAYFDITRQNVATADPNAPPFLNALVATGEQRSQGVELDILGEILPGWNIVANYAYTDARVTEDNTIPTGNGLAGIPEHSANVWTTYTLQDGDLAGLGFGFGLNYVSDRPGDLNDSFQLDDYLITNAAIFYERDNWDLALNFQNLFDTNYIQGIPISRTRGIQPGEPLTIIGSFSIQF
ncbi:MAG: TonB-dependent siderophore receptor [Leptolyngbya sp. SIO4C5]|nr:TonB-dependent siderophore receptor [Leptolyngbya sp. SIO4C5]